MNNYNNVNKKHKTKSTAVWLDNHGGKYDNPFDAKKSSEEYNVQLNISKELKKQNDPNYVNYDTSGGLIIATLLYKYWPIIWVVTEVWGHIFFNTSVTLKVLNVAWQFVLAIWEVIQTIFLTLTGKIN